MKTMFRSKFRFILIPLFGIAFLLLVSFLVMFLWNYTLPVIFGIQAINLWQAMALFLLCKILFGFGKGGPKGPGAPWMRKRYKKFDNLSAAEKEKMKAYMRSRWCHWDDPAVVTENDDDVETNEK